MKCPPCQVELKMTDRQGVEIDYCPQCRGVWLDRGELDKIIERSEQRFGSTDRPVQDDRRDDRRDGRSDDDRHERRDYDGKKRRGGWFGDFFDFD
jgi:Zn-finger nucleic acid-binding protein